MGGLLTSVFGLPLAPLRGVIRLGELIARQVEREQHDPAAVRRELEEIERSRNAGEISADQAAQAEQQVLDRMVRPIR